MVANWREKRVMSLSETLPLDRFPLLDLGNVDALAAQGSIGRGFAGGPDLAPNDLAGLVLALPGKVGFLRGFLLGCLACCGHRLLLLDFWFWPLCLTPKNGRQPPLKLRPGILRHEYAESITLRRGGEAAPS
jgi:hypothetical protein